MEQKSKILIGISACLLGENVRFDGGNKKDAFITLLLSKYFEFYPLCPEVEAGLGVPRPPIRLIGDPNDPQVVEVKNPANNHTHLLKSYAEKRLQQLPQLSGFILKSKSPSCGMERVKVYQANGMSSLPGQGILAHKLLEKFPSLPVEEEGRLCDPQLRENFIERIFIYKRWQEIQSKLTHKAIIEFHQNIKLTLMAHNIVSYQQLGQKIAVIGHHDIETFADNYFTELMDALKQIATPKSHTNVLQHCMGYLKKHLTPAEKAELLDIIEQYHLQLLPLIVPITLLQHYFKKYPSDYISKQIYLNPYPKEFMLRNFI